jgi:hypothetical protein
MNNEILRIYLTKDRDYKEFSKKKSRKKKKFIMKETIKLSIAAIVSMLIGSHCVYLYYKPMSVC